MTTSEPNSWATAKQYGYFFNNNIHNSRVCFYVGAVYQDIYKIKCHYFILTKWQNVTCMFINRLKKKYNSICFTEWVFEMI